MLLTIAENNNIADEWVPIVRVYQLEVHTVVVLQGTTRFRVLCFYSDIPITTGREEATAS